MNLNQKGKQKKRKRNRKKKKSPCPNWAGLGREGPARLAWPRWPLAQVAAPPPRPNSRINEAKRGAKARLGARTHDHALLHQPPRPLRYESFSEETDTQPRCSVPLLLTELKKTEFFSESPRASKRRRGSPQHPATSIAPVALNL